MSRYDDLFDATETSQSVFADKGALDPLAQPDEIVARDDQEERLANILQGANDGYLPTTVSIYGPPGTGKTVITRRIARAYTDRNSDVEAVYVNLKECRTVFSAANEILYALVGEKKDTYVGLDGVFTAIWEALDDYPEWTVLILDEIDHVRHDSNYDPNEFFYRLLRGEGKLKRGLNLSVFMISNELIDVDLRLDSRVESAMGGEEVFFPPYGAEEFREIVETRVDAAFEDGAITSAAVDRGVRETVERWGDARRGLRLFRRAGELANKRGLRKVSVECIEDSLKGTEREAMIWKLQQLPLRHLIVLTASVGWRDGGGDIVQPIRVSRIPDRLADSGLDERFKLGQRAVQKLIRELETMGLVETWTDSEGRNGRAMFMQTTFVPEWVQEAQEIVTDDVFNASE